jgi:ubiquinone/menaquinone biosynthesis C-methylase UbiE
MDESVYLHGTAPVEQDRLSLLNDLLNEAALQMMNLKGGERILDVGSGLGQLTRAMARASGKVVVGVERSPEQIADGKRRAAENHEEVLIDLRQGSAVSLPLTEQEWGAFDVVHTRFLLEHVQDPLAVVRMMVAAARPGGRIILQDDDHEVLRIDPEPEGFYNLWNAYQKTFENVGNDPQIGRRLVQLLQQAGTVPVRNHWLFFGSCSGHPHFSLYVRNLLGVIDTGKNAILSAKLLPLSEYDAAVRAIEEWAKSPGAALWYAVCYAEGTKKT